jgi:glutathione S-transferase
VAPHTLYGTPLSLYTGKARSYLIKNGLPYRELAPATAHYLEEVLPLARARVIPTVETADGIVIRDGTAIVEHFESEAGHPAMPRTPRQRILSRLWDVIGMEGLLRPAMHYRWNFPNENEAFLQHHFGVIAPAGADREAVAKQLMARMRQAAVAFGVVPDQFEAIEARYLAFLDLLDRHFAVSPYLLGGRPSVGDFSLIAPMYGHLGRDPKPLSILQSRAIHVFRWVERMNRSELDVGEFVADGSPTTNGDFLPNDEVPQTLIDVLRHMAIDFVPETVAAAAFINEWLAAQEDLPSGTPFDRGVGLANFEVEGVKLHGLAQPHRFYLLNRVQADFDALGPEDRAAVESLLDDCHLSPVLSARLTRGIEFGDNLEVWA